MPIIKSAIKRDRQSKNHRIFNRAVKANVKKSMRSIIDPVKNNLKVEATSLSEAFSTIDKAVKKGVLHKNTAARKKSRIAKLFSQVSVSATTEVKKTKAAAKSPKAKTATKPSRAKKVATTASAKK